MATVIIRDPSIADCNRWETNEKDNSSRLAEHSAECRVRVRSLRSQTTTSGRVPRLRLPLPGTRISTLGIQGTRIRTLRRMPRTMFGLSGYRSSLI